MFLSALIIKKYRADVILLCIYISNLLLISNILTIKSLGKKPSNCNYFITEEIYYNLHLKPSLKGRVAEQVDFLPSHSLLTFLWRFLTISLYIDIKKLPTYITCTTLVYNSLVCALDATPTLSIMIAWE